VAVGCDAIAPRNAASSDFPAAFSRATAAIGYESGFIQRPTPKSAVFVEESGHPRERDVVEIGTDVTATD
jgi:hypothetical protein